MTSASEIPISEADLALVGPWMAKQRWYANKGAHPVLEEIARWELPGAHGARFITHLLIDHAPGAPTLYQVPLSYRREALGGPGTLGRSGSTWVHDGPQDPGHVAALFRLLTSGLGVHGVSSLATGVRNPGTLAMDAASPHFRSRVLGGEQSNTSIIGEWPGTGATPVMCKLFRTLHNGANPDVELPGVLSSAGSSAVPRAVGHVSAEWPDTGQPSGRAYGHIAVAQEYLAGAEDGWRVALETASRGDSFDERARHLGILTAEVHGILAAHLPTQLVGPGVIDDAVQQMRGRLALALHEVPALGEHRRALEGIVDAAISAPWPTHQRIHGDLHLGQVLDVPGRGWVMVDFEGEPLRPMIERNRRDSPLRDLAGMLRSFDYVAGTIGVTSGEDAGAWARSSRSAFMDGYAIASGTDLAEYRAVLAAFEADKALYEAVYEARNRPGWLPIPVGAIERISSQVNLRS